MRWGDAAAAGQLPPRQSVSQAQAGSATMIRPSSLAGSCWQLATPSPGPTPSTQARQGAWLHAASSTSLAQGPVPAGRSISADRPAIVTDSAQGTTVTERLQGTPDLRGTTHRRPPHEFGPTGPATPDPPPGTDARSGPG